MTVHVSLKWKGDSPSSCIQNFFHGISFTSIEIEKKCEINDKYSKLCKKKCF